MESIPFSSSCQRFFFFFFFFFFNFSLRCSHGSFWLENGSASHLCFHPDYPHHVAINVGPRIRVFDGQYSNVEPLKSFSKFKGSSFGVSYRSDGKLLVSGGEDGRIRVFEERSRTLMKQFKGHVGPARVSKFCVDKITVMSGGDDGSVRHWDVATETQLFSVRLHSDHVRCGMVEQSSPYVWVTGGYDKMVAGLDIRSQEAAFKISLKEAVEEMCAVHGDSSVAIANGNAVDMYDLRAFDKGAFASLSNHAKTVTCVHFQDGRLLSGSVDQTVKVWSAADDYECVMTQRYTSPVLCVGLAPSSQFFVVGMSDGTISMQHRPPLKSSEAEEEKKYYSVKNKKHFTRGADHKPEKGDFRVPGNQNRVHKSNVDNLLRKYRFKEALDASLREKEFPGLTIALLSDLIDRRVLDGALAGRDEEGLDLICNFVLKNVTKPHYDEVCMDVLERLIEIYSPVFNQSPALTEQFQRMKRKIEEEVSVQMTYVEISGCIETIENEQTKA